MSKAPSQTEIIDFVRKTTEAITVISETNKQLVENTGAIKEAIDSQNISTARGFENLNVKMEGLATMFKYVIAPLVAGILGIVGVKTFFKL